MRLQCFLILIVATFVTAWLPGEDKNITAQDGTDRFHGKHHFTNRTVTGRRAAKRWLPASGPIRGVNLGSMFVFEPWMAGAEWYNMGCGPYASEFDCVQNLGQARANAAFQDHWNNWIQQSDIYQMASYGLNTIRIPVGYWIREDLVAANEFFPQGGLAHLQQVCGWASDMGFYIIMDLHGAPGAQQAYNAFTGMNVASPGFYNDYNFERALQFLEWMAKEIHTTHEFRNVGMLEVVNEPLQNAGSVGSMMTSYYPKAYNRIRSAENGLGITSNNQLHVQYMNAKWGTGDPASVLPNQNFVAYDDHRYMKWDSSVAVSQSSYLATSCSDNRGGNTPTIVGEFSLSVPDAVQWSAGWLSWQEQAFYKKWFAAQTMAYERQYGWIFWSWKTTLGDYRWSYQDAVNAGVIPTNIGDIYNMGAC